MHLKKSKSRQTEISKICSFTIILIYHYLSHVIYHNIKNGRTHIPPFLYIGQATRLTIAAYSSLHLKTNFTLNNKTDIFNCSTCGNSAVIVH